MSHIDGKSFEYRQIVEAEKRIAKLEAALREARDALTPGYEPSGRMKILGAHAKDARDAIDAVLGGGEP